MDGDCVCIYDNSDGDQPRFHAESIIKARKAHVCYECRLAIPVGAHYERVAGKWDYGMEVYKTCLLCREIRHALCCDSWTYGQLWEDIEEQMFSERPGGIDSACLDKLSTVDAKQFLQRRWWEWVQERTS